jgi:asparagine synthase (glutamine-hydrolysing)
MCGIAGFLLREGLASVAAVKAMCDPIRYRGPDDEGFYVDRGCGIGMRRLSIIDLSTGHQPISNEDGSLWIVFNGEIYNYQDLRRDLLARGHRFATNSDTETILHLYEEYGVESFSRLRGMFAFAIWDSHKRELTLVRDRFGKKPLYYSETPAGLYFGSELKCLRAAGVPLDLDREALRLYFQFWYIPDPFTPYRTVRKLAPGSWMRYGSDGTVAQGSYWKLPPFTDQPGPDTPSEEETARRVRELFDESVRIRMIADVPLGAFLSGGIDSSSVVASMALQSPEPVKTFSIGFEEADFNELPYAAAVARQYKTDHHEIMVRPDSVELISRLVRYFDEPFGDSSAIPTFIVSEFARRNVKVALSGDGGDELFGGYTSLVRVDQHRFADAFPGWLRWALRLVADRLPYKAYGKNYLRMLSQPTPLERYFSLNYSPYYLRQALLAPEWMLPADAAYLTRTLSHCLMPGKADILSQVMYFEASSNLTGDMLVKVDRMSMANSLEVRCPLLDHKLAELAATIPNGWKLRNGKGKQILLRAVGDRLDPGLLNRPKMGFAVPLRHWFRTSLRAFLWDHLTSAAFSQRGIAAPEFVRVLLDEHQSGRRDNSMWLWMLLMLELWFRLIEEERGAPALGESRRAPPATRVLGLGA